MEKQSSNHSYSLKFLHTDQEKNEFDEIVNKHYLSKNKNNTFGLKDLNYYVVLDENKNIVAGCKLAYSCRVPSSNSHTGHRFLIDRLEEKLNLGIDLSEYASSQDKFAEISRMFSLQAWEPAKVLLNSINSLFAYQKIEYILALLEDNMARLISRYMGEAIKLDIEPHYCPAHNANYYLYKITHKLNNELRLAQAEGHELEFLMSLTTSKNILTPNITK